MNNSKEKILEHIVGRMQQDKTIDAPADAVRYAKNLYRTRAAEPKLSMIHRVLAVMQIDLAPNRAAFGERSAAASQVRQMLFSAGENSVDLRIEKDGKTFKITGQILGEGFASAEVKINDTETSFETQTNDLSEFKVENIVEGTYVLVLTGDDKEIVLKNLEIN